VEIGVDEFAGAVSIAKVRRQAVRNGRAAPCRRGTREAGENVSRETSLPSVCGEILHRGKVSSTRIWEKYFTRLWKYFSHL
jgi:hypothetical protein